MIARKMICAAVMLLLTLSACGGSDETAQVTENITAPAEIKTHDNSQTDNIPDYESTVTPVPTASPTPTPEPVYVRPSFANVISGSDAYADERGSFIAMKNSLIILLPSETAGRYVWHCMENGGDGNFSFTERDTEKIPYTYPGGKYGGVKTLKSKVNALADAAEDSEPAITVTEVPKPEQRPEENVNEAEGDTGYEEYEEYEVYEEYPEEIIEEYVIEEYEEVPEEEYYYDYEEQYEPVSIKIPSDTGMKKARTGIMNMSAAAGSLEGADEYTYVYSPCRKEYTFTADSAGTSVYCLEYTGNNNELDSGFVVYMHADEGLNVTFDLVWYSFADCVAAPDGVSEEEASVTEQEAEELARSASEEFDSCVRENNMLGAAAEMIEGAYWEAFVMDPAVAGISSNGGAFYHEDYKDYAWDVFTVNPVSPGRTTAYFTYRTGGDERPPRMQIADILVGEDLSVTVHVRRYDLGVEFD